VSSAAGRVTLSFLILLLLPIIGACAPDIAVVPDNPRPGEVMFVTLRPERELLRAACSWSGRSYRFLSEDDHYGLVLPVPLTTKAGGHHATVYWKYVDGAMGKASVPIEVRGRKFGVQHLRLTREQEKKYTAAETKRERRLIGEALSRVGPERYWGGDFVIPVEGRISTAFGLQRYVNRRLAYRHRGVDIAAPAGTPVLAAADGVVSLADDSFLLHGQTVVLDHGQGVCSLYIHLSEIGVASGEKVAQGQAIGRVGATGVATGPHLHFGVYAYHEAVDPLFWMQLPDR
jgi:murein DD-endopeptidase MepM/ murein hydrolase activator NlpD